MTWPVDAHALLLRIGSSFFCVVLALNRAACQHALKTSSYYEWFLLLNATITWLNLVLAVRVNLTFISKFLRIPILYLAAKQRLPSTPQSPITPLRGAPISPVSSATGSSNFVPRRWLSAASPTPSPSRPARFTRARSWPTAPLVAGAQRCRSTRRRQSC